MVYFCDHGFFPTKREINLRDVKVEHSVPTAVGKEGT